jgi:peptidoglycan L-alanyl-D-glutamate endopeptidase CwlK
MSGSVLKVNNELLLLPLHFREAVQQAIEDCRVQGLDPLVYEGYRSQELQALYYARGRTVIPPTKPVTNASSNLYSWHGYCLAVDVISEAHGWEPPGGEKWFARVAEHFRRHGCRWGGEWKIRDLPHFQWGRCKPSPSEVARQLIRTQGLEAVWLAVGAIPALPR